MLSGPYRWVSVRPGRPKIIDSNSNKPNLVYMYYMHSGYWTSIFGKKNCAYYIRIFTVKQHYLRLGLYADFLTTFRKIR